MSRKSPQELVEEPFITGLGLIHFVTLSERMGLPVDDVLERVGMTDRDKDFSPIARIPKTRVEALLSELILASGDESFGHNMGRQLAFGDYAIFVQLVTTGGCTREAIQMAAKYQALVCGTACGYEFENVPSGMKCYWNMVHSNSVIRRHATENVFAILLKFVRFIFGDDEAIPEFHMEHAPASEHALQAMTEFYQGKIHFNADRNYVLVSHEQLDRKLNPTGVFSLSSVEEQAQEQMRALQHQSNVLEGIQWQLMDIMRTASPRREHLARQMKISVRTLDRRLAEVGVSWQQLLDSVRSRLAREYLSDDNNTIEDVAGKLGFSSSGSFQRRFRHWMGMTPSEYRKSRRDS